jgi:hypothetical protein
MSYGVRTVICSWFWGDFGHLLSFSASQLWSQIPLHLVTWPNGETATTALLMRCHHPLAMLPLECLG